MANDLSYILYLEDSKLEIMRFQMALEASEYSGKVEIAMNGEKGLDFLNERRHHLPKLIVLDLRMPVMNGFEFLEKMKNDLTFRRIPIIVLSSSKNEKDIIQCYDYQIAGYFTKPFSMNDYNKIVESIASYWGQAKIVNN